LVSHHYSDSFSKQPRKNWKKFFERLCKERERITSHTLLFSDRADIKMKDVDYEDFVAIIAEKNPSKDTDVRMEEVITDINGSNTFALIGIYTAEEIFVKVITCVIFFSYGIAV